MSLSAMTISKYIIFNGSYTAKFRSLSYFILIILLSVSDCDATIYFSIKLTHFVGAKIIGGLILLFKLAIALE